MGAQTRSTPDHGSYSCSDGEGSRSIRRPVCRRTVLYSLRHRAQRHRAGRPDGANRSPTPTARHVGRYRTSSLQWSRFEGRAGVQRGRQAASDALARRNLNGVSGLCWHNPAVPTGSIGFQQRAGIKLVKPPPSAPNQKPWYSRRSAVYAADVVGRTSRSPLPFRAMKRPPPSMGPSYPVA
jgi:hypothetical protein